MTSKPLISIIIPAYNAEKYLGRAIQSAITQTYENIEIIVIDDGSFDSTVGVARGFADQRMYYFRQENKGQGVARNRGIKESRGKYITFLDADDIYLPQKVERQTEFLEKNPDYKIVYCHTLHFYAANPGALFKKKCSHFSGDIFDKLLRSPLINLNTAMFHREALEKIGGFNETRYWPEEWDLWLRLAGVGYKFGHIDEDLVKVEIREESNTTMEVQAVLKKYTLDMFEKLFSKMPQEKRNQCDASKILDNLKMKAALAYLLNNNMAGFSGAIKSIRTFWMRFIFAVVGGVAGAIPPAPRKKLLTGLWRQWQRRNFIKLNP